ncbi:MAG TPA: hypothetical protein PKV44_03440 [Bacillota bacterium]|nr:hypothetical protein [Bacillota bacterium]HPE39063.1 hypothetical protein [Bacillota bacterium]
MPKHKRIISFIIFIAFTLGMLFSVLFIALEADHDCTGEHCPICLQIEICENTINKISFAIVSVSIIITLKQILVKILPIINEQYLLSTPITLKDKMTN